MAVHYQDDLADITEERLRGGFFEGWSAPPDPAGHLRILVGSDLVGVAVDGDTGLVIGFVTALTDGVQAAFVPLLEILPDYRGRGIATALMRRMLDRLGALNSGEGVNVDLSCDEDLVPFYRELGMRPGRAMWIRPHLDRRGV